jgi:hypothetical protein
MLGWAWKGQGRLVPRKPAQLPLGQKELAWVRERVSAVSQVLVLVPLGLEEHGQGLEK